MMAAIARSTLIAGARAALGVRDRQSRWSRYPLSAGELAGITGSFQALGCHFHH
jgi:hypothetical protein